MPRINPLSPETASGKSKTLFEAVKSKLGMVPNMMKAMGNDPAVLEAYLSFSGSLGHGELPLKTRESIALLFAQTTGCEYCLAAHSAIGKGAGLAAADINAARRGQGADPRTTGALAFAKRLLDTQGAVTDADVRAARDAGLTDGQLMEIVGHVALNLFTNFFNKAFSTDVDFPKVSLTGQAA